MNNNTAIMGLLEQTLNMHSNDDDDKKQVESSREQAEAQSSGETIYMDPAGTITRSCPAIEQDRDGVTCIDWGFRGQSDNSNKSYKRPAQKDTWFDTRAVIALIVLICLIGTAIVLIASLV